MVKRDTVEGEITSLESKQDETTDIFENIKLLDERVRKPLADKQIGPDAPPAE